MSLNKVDQKSFAYTLLWRSVKLWHDVFFYHKIEISHLDRVPKKGALIFTPNHQNALMDALAVLFSLKRTLVFLARADLFKKKTIAESMYFLRILPVFRPRDGQGEVKKNQDTFDKTTEVLQKNLGLVLFPEGNHGDKHSLRTLKKGFARIAFQTEEGNDYKMDIKIVPMGILYSNYQDCKSVVSIVFGHPMSLKKYHEDYKKHPPTAYKLVQNDLSQEIKKYMVQIEDDEYYDSIDFLQTAFWKVILDDKSKDYNNQIELSQAAIQKILSIKEKSPKKFSEIHEKTSAFLKKSRLLDDKQKYQLVHYKKSEYVLQWLILFLLSPLLILSYALIYPAIGSSLYITTKIKDPQFKSSIKFGVSLILVPLFFLLEWGIFHWLFPLSPSYYFVLIYLISLIVSSISGAFVRRFFTRSKLLIFSLKKAQTYRELQTLSASIRSLLS